MAKYSKIGWTNHTMKFWSGCNKVSAGCQTCYIGNFMRRFGSVGKGKRRLMSLDLVRDIDQQFRDANVPVFSSRRI